MTSEDKWHRRVLRELFGAQKPPERLPGSLCDQTPGTETVKPELHKPPAGTARPPLTTEQQHTPPSPACVPGAECTRCAGLEQLLRSTELQLALAQPIPPAPAAATGALQHDSELRAQLAEALVERDDEARINDDLRRTITTLRARVEGLELTVLSLTRTSPATAPQDHEDGLLTPWPRAAP